MASPGICLLPFDELRVTAKRSKNRDFRLIEKKKKKQNDRLHCIKAQTRRAYYWFVFANSSSFPTGNFVIYKFSSILPLWGYGGRKCQSSVRSRWQQQRKKQNTMILRLEERCGPWILWENVSLSMLCDSSGSCGRRRSKPSNCFEPAVRLRIKYTKERTTCSQQYSSQAATIVHLPLLKIRQQHLCEICCVQFTLYY